MDATIIAASCAVWVWRKVLFPLLKRGSRDLRDKFVSDINEFEMRQANEKHAKDIAGVHLVEHD